MKLNLVYLITVWWISNMIKSREINKTQFIYVISKVVKLISVLQAWMGKQNSNITLNKKDIPRIRLFKHNAWPTLFNYTSKLLQKPPRFYFMWETNFQIKIYVYAPLDIITVYAFPINSFLPCISTKMHFAFSQN